MEIAELLDTESVVRQRDREHCDAAISASLGEEQREIYANTQNEDQC